MAWPQTPEEIQEQIYALNEEAIFFAEFEEALVGYVERFNEAGNHILVALYDRDKCIDILVQNGMEDAEDFFCTNVEGAYIGPHTPAFATLAKQASL